MEQKILTRQQFKEEEQKRSKKRESKFDCYPSGFDYNGCWVNRPYGYNRSINRL